MGKDAKEANLRRRGEVAGLVQRMTWWASVGLRPRGASQRRGQACQALSQRAFARDSGRTGATTHYNSARGGRSGRRDSGSQSPQFGQADGTDQPTPKATSSVPRHRSIQSLTAIWIPRHKRKPKWTCRRRATAGVGQKGCRCTGDRAGVVGGNRRRRVNPDTNGETVPTTRRPGPEIDWGRDEHEKGSRNLTHLACRASILAVRPCRMRMGNVGGGAMRRANGKRKGGNTAPRQCVCQRPSKRAIKRPPLAKTDWTKGTRHKINRQGRVTLDGTRRRGNRRRMGSDRDLLRL